MKYGIMARLFWKVFKSGYERRFADMVHIFAGNKQKKRS